jgi:hypothetical protein
MNPQEHKHRKETSGFIWGTWIMLFGAAVLGHDAIKGLRTGEWVDLSGKGGGLLAPWWVAAALSLGFLLFSLWCFVEYVKLKRRPPIREAGDMSPHDG